MNRCPAGSPNRFFTAAINGCSVFVTGAANAPTVHHAGGDTSTNGLAAQAAFWRNLMVGLGHVGVAEVNKEDYIKNSTVLLDGGGHTTQAARDYKAWLEADYAGELEIEDVRPWGAVIGLRDGAGNWSFYLQENASVSYYTLAQEEAHVQEVHHGPRKGGVAGGRPPGAGANRPQAHAGKTDARVRDLPQPRHPGAHQPADPALPYRLNTRRAHRSALAAYREAQELHVSLGGETNSVGVAPQSIASVEMQIQSATRTVMVASG